MADSFTLVVGRSAVVTTIPGDAATPPNTLPIDGTVAWATSDATKVRILPLPGGNQAAGYSCEVTAVAAGAASVTATYDVLIGAGTSNIIDTWAITTSLAATVAVGAQSHKFS